MTHLRSSFSLSLLLAFILLLPLSTLSIKFTLPAQRFPNTKCFWNTAHTGALVIVTANVSPGPNQRIDIEIVDSSPKKNVYLSKKNITAESRLAVTAHAEGEVGVCFKNFLDPSVPIGQSGTHSRTVDLDVDIGADAVDYNAIANQESLSVLETEMRKLEGIVKELVDEMNFLKRREERFSDTNLSTNKRVQSFAWFTLLSLIALGIWQIFHLRAFFKRKYLID